MRKVKKEDCLGCDDNMYNCQGECWHFKNAVIEKVIAIGIDEMPPFKRAAIKKPNCYHRKRYAFIKPDVLRLDGFWKS